MCIRNIILIFALALWAASFAGCTSLRGAQQARETREVSESMLLQERMRQLSGRLDNIQTQIDQLWTELEEVRQSSRSDARAVADNIDNRLQELEREIGQIDAARTADKQDIIDKMTSRLSKLMSANNAGSSSNRRISEYGVEHTVQPGQTLSEIAAAYNVKIDVLVEANSLKNPNALRAGQKLFIPE